MMIDLLPELLSPRGYVAAEEILPADDVSGADEASPLALVSRAVAAALADRQADALALLDEARSAAGDTAERLLVMLNRAQALLESGDLAGADDQAAAALRLARRERHDGWAARAGLGTALVHLARGRRNDARARLGEAVRLFARAGHALRQVQCHYLLGEIAYLGDDNIRAGAHYRDALGIARSAGADAWVELLTLKFEHR